MPIQRGDIVDDPDLGGGGQIIIEHIADLTAVGNTVDGIAGEIMAFGETAYLKSDGKYWKTDANAEATSKGQCVMVLKTMAADEHGIFLKRGAARNDAWTWTTKGALLYLNSTPGAMSESQPLGAGDIVRIVGYVIDTTHIFFEADDTFVELI